MYSETLSSLSCEATLFQHIARLQGIQEKTEDAVLADNLSKVLHLLRIEHGKATQQQQAMRFYLHTSFREEIKNLMAYCQTCASDRIPEWQVIARREGWTPPVGKA